MSEYDNSLRLTKAHWTVLVSVPVIWQAYLWIRGIVVASYFYRVLTAMNRGTEPDLSRVSRVSEFVLETHWFWALIPLAMGAAVYHFYAKEHPTATHALVLCGMGALLALGMSALLWHGVDWELLRLQPVIDRHY